MSLNAVNLNTAKKVSPYLSKPIKAMSETRFMKWMAKNYEKDPIKFISLVGLSSILFKDSLGCYLYVKQSLHNEKIPKEKRGFVAALDLTNGVLMLATQVAAFFTISNNKVQKFLFDKSFGRYFNHERNKGYRDLLKNDKKYSNISKFRFNNDIKKYEGVCRGAFKIALPLVAATIIAKRMIVPFVATPAASWAKTHILKDDSDVKKADDNTEKTIVTQNNSTFNAFETSISSPQCFKKQN